MWHIRDIKSNCLLSDRIISRYCYQLYLVLIDVVQVFMILLAIISAILRCHKSPNFIKMIYKENRLN